MFNDLREFIDKAREIGECQVVEGADWNEEIGAVCDLQAQRTQSPLLLFDKIKGYPAGYRVTANLGASLKRVALAFGLPLEAQGMAQVAAFRERLKENIERIPPVEVATGPVKENVLTGKDIDLFKFPAPKWHELDGGRYIGTGSAGVMRDPDEGWINLGTYRTQIQDKTTATMGLATGHHGAIIAQKYWDKGLACPVALCCGEAPLIFAAAHFEIPWGFSEYEWAGGWQRKPIEVVKGEYTGLPIPATAEIVLEGELVPPSVETRKEGPFGEWHGYYAAGMKGIRQMPAFRIKSIMHRNNPIILGSPPSVPPRGWTLGRHTQMVATLWDDLDRQLPGVKGVWFVEEAALHCIIVISLKQMYGGHAKQAALCAAGSLIGGYASRYIIIVDEDIDPSNMSEVLWAVGTRSDAADIEVIRGCWGSPSNPRLTPEQRQIDDKEHSLGIIMACRPYKWIKDFAPSIKTSPGLAKRVQSKWPVLFK